MWFYFQWAIFPKCFYCELFLKIGFNRQLESNFIPMYRKRIWKNLLSVYASEKSQIFIMRFLCPGRIFSHGFYPKKDFFRTESFWFLLSIWGVIYWTFLSKWIYFINMFDTTRQIDFFCNLIAISEYRTFRKVFQ